MSEESTTPDLVALTRSAYAPANLDRGDFDAMLSFTGPDSVWDVSPFGLGTFEGREAIRGFFEDWIGAYQDFEIEPETVLDLGGGVVLATVRQTATPIDSNGRVELRYAAVLVWDEGVVTRTTNYPDIDEARADAERLAEERG